MAFEVDLEEMMREESMDANKILNEYFSTKNINLKTQIDALTEFTTLDTIAKNFNKFVNLDGNKHKFKETPKTINYWMDRFKEYAVSHQRKSRIEVGEVLKALKQQETGDRSLLQKFLGTGKT